MECPRCRLLSPPEALRCDCGWDFATQSMERSYLLPACQNQPALARLEHRMGGRIVDMVIAFAFIVVANAALQAPLSSNSSVETAVECMILGYLLFADGMKGGQSIGKRIFHTAVVDATTLTPCSLGQSAVRNISLLLLHILDWGFIFRAKRQRLGDRLAGTIVITTAPAPPKADVPETEGPPLSEDEVATTRQVYAGFSTSRLEELHESLEGLRPGAAQLVSEELEKRERAARGGGAASSSL